MFTALLNKYYRINVAFDFQAFGRGVDHFIKIIKINPGIINIFKTLYSTQNVYSFSKLNRVYVNIVF